MKYLSFLLSFVIILLLNSCSKNIPFEVEEALKLSENNRPELEKVIDHYRNSGDSLKLKAAFFLIQNMRYHYYYDIGDSDAYNCLFDSISKLKFTWKPEDELWGNIIFRGRLIDSYVNNFFKNRRGIENYARDLKFDIQSINSSYLIENIDYAFKAWEFPWAKHYSFEEFCKYILPYRYGTEAPGRWRKKYYTQFKWICDSLNNNRDVIEATCFINNLFRNKISHAKSLGKLGNHIQAIHLSTGMVVEGCNGQTGLGVCILRAIGVPVSIISIPWWGNRNYGHNMNALLDSTKNWNYFAFDDWDPSNKKQNFSPKMYLTEFGKLKYPEIGNNYFLKDASQCFQPVKEIKNHVKNSEGSCLCVFGDRSWEVIANSNKDSSGIYFNNVGMKDYMYLTAEYHNSEIIPVTYPFTTDSTGEPFYFVPDTTDRISFTFERKYPLKHKEERCKALIGGEFQFSDEKSFSAIKYRYKIQKELKYHHNLIKIPSLKSKYVRFVFPQNIRECENGPAELAIYKGQDHDCIRIEGKYSGTPNITDEQIKKLFDQDILTYVEWRTNENLINSFTSNVIIKKDKKELIWVCIELEESTEITHLGICPRNDKNGIYPGMLYELVYWDKEWKSLGIKKAKADTISFNNIPSNAVLWLRNLSEGKEERIFTIKDKEQVWW